MFLSMLTISSLLGFQYYLGNKCQKWREESTSEADLDEEFMSIFRSHSFWWATLATSLILVSPAPASAETTTMAVTATVQSACTITITPMTFGAYTGAVTVGTATTTLTCTNTTPYTVALSAGIGAGATVTNRSMTGGGGALNYTLFRDPARTLNWGATAGTDTVAGTGSGSGQAVTVYGQIPAGQGVAAGVYSDTITATVTY